MDGARRLDSDRAGSAADPDDICHWGKNEGKGICLSARISNASLFPLFHIFFALLISIHAFYVTGPVDPFLALPLFFITGEAWRRE